MKMMERQFDEELWNLKSKMLEMAERAQKMVGLSVRALVERQADKANVVHQLEKGVNTLEIEIEKEVLRLLALRQPAAKDLRFLMGALKITSDLERIADQACNVSETTRYLLREAPLAMESDIPELARLSQKMIQDSIEAFVTHDAALADLILKEDDAVDELKRKIFDELLLRMQSEPRSVTRAVDLILISRNLERIADHATNIAEEVIFIEKGDNMKHHNLVYEGGIGID